MSEIIVTTKIIPKHIEEHPRNVDQGKNKFALLELAKSKNLEV